MLSLDAPAVSPTATCGWLAVRAGGSALRAAGAPPPAQPRRARSLSHIDLRVVGGARRRLCCKSRRRAPPTTHSAANAQPRRDRSLSHSDLRVVGGARRRLCCEGESVARAMSKPCWCRAQSSGFRVQG